MLSTAQKGKTKPATMLTPQEDRQIRQAFGRYGVDSERGPAAEIVKRVQETGPGHWLLCDCLGEADERPPALVPVASNHIRRHSNVRWPPHAPDCDFFREPAEQRRATATFRTTGSIPRLVTGYVSESQVYRPHLSGISHAEERSPLAQLLLGLVNAAGLQHVRPEWIPADLPGQYRDLRRAAKQIALTDTIKLASCLETYAPTFETFRTHIETLPETGFRKSRPHGVFITAARSISEGSIDAMEGFRIPVLGRLSVFGEIEGHGRIQDPAARRPPYLVACIVARPDKASPAAILRAYAHPVASRAHLLLLDSDNERRTLRRLMDIKSWLAQTRNVETTIEKPQFDIGPPFDPDGAHPETESRPPIIPDFVVRAKREGGPEARVIVETMGYEDERYVERKRLVHPRMRAALNDTPMVLHHFRSGKADQDSEDREFNRNLMRWIFRQIEPREPSTRPAATAHPLITAT